MKIVDFDKKYIDAAAELLQMNQNRALQAFGKKAELSRDECKSIIGDELEKQTSSTIILLEGDKLIAYAIAVIKDDQDWGNSGWVNMGGWSIDMDYTHYAPVIYQHIAREWVRKKIYDHYILVFADDNRFLDFFFELGFGKEHAHGILDFSCTEIIDPGESQFIYRKAKKEDQDQVAGFSRIIADYQAGSPCFAGAPKNYLMALDNGFSTLTEDKELDLYVAEDKGKLIGYQAFYKEENSYLFIPPNSVELAVSGVIEEYRKKGVGKGLTEYALNRQKELKYDYCVTDWRTTNVLSSKFWQKNGFKSVAFRLHRRINPELN